MPKTVSKAIPVLGHDGPSTSREEHAHTWALQREVRGHRIFRCSGCNVWGWSCPPERTEVCEEKAALPAPLRYLVPDPEPTVFTAAERLPRCILRSRGGSIVAATCCRAGRARSSTRRVTC